MLPNSRSNSPLNALDRLLRLAVIFVIGWFLFTYFVPRPAAAVPVVVKSAGRALQTGNTTLASTLFDKYLAEHRSDPGAYEIVERICEQAKRYDLMTGYARRAVMQCANASHEDLAQLYLLEAQALYNEGSNYYQQARAAATQARSLDPDNPETLNEEGYLIAEMSTDMPDLITAEHLIAQALKSLNNSFSLSDQSFQLAGYEDSYGWVLYKEGLYGPPGARDSYFARATDALVQATDDLPPQAPGEDAKVLYYHLAVVYHKAGQIDNARQALQVALHYDPKYDKALAELQSLTHAASPPSAPLAASPPATPGRTPVFTPLKNSG